MATKRSNGEGSVYRDSERGGWVGQLYIDGRRRKVRAKTKSDVLARLAALRRAEADGIVVNGNATVSQLLRLWRERVIAARPIGSSTRQRYLGALAALDAELGTVRLRRLDVDTVERALDTIATGCRGRGRPLTRTTLSRIRQTLIAALDFGVRRKMLAYNPAAMAELSRECETEPATALLDTRRGGAPVGRRWKASGSATSSD